MKKEHMVGLGVLAVGVAAFFLLRGGTPVQAGSGTYNPEASIPEILLALPPEAAVTFPAQPEPYLWQEPKVPLNYFTPPVTEDVTTKKAGQIPVAGQVKSSSLFTPSGIASVGIGQAVLQAIFGVASLPLQASYSVAKMAAPGLPSITDVSTVLFSSKKEETVAMTGGGVTPQSGLSLIAAMPPSTSGGSGMSGAQIRASVITTPGASSAAFASAASSYAGSGQPSASAQVQSVLKKFGG